MRHLAPTSSPSRRCTAALLWLLAGVVGACGGGPNTEKSSCTADCGPGPDPDGRWSDCVDDVVELGLDEATVVGFTGAQVLATLEGERTGVVHWTWDAEGGECDSDSGTPALGDLVTDVTIEVTSNAQGVRQIESTPRYSGPSAPPSCAAPRLEFDVDLRVATGDGGFDETWSAVAFAHSTSPPAPGLFYVNTPQGASLDVCDEHLVLIEHVVDPATLQGSYDAGSLYGADFPAGYDPIVTTLRLLFCGDEVVGESDLFAERTAGMVVEGVGGPGLRLQAGREGCIGR